MLGDMDCDAGDHLGDIVHVSCLTNGPNNQHCLTLVDWVCDLESAPLPPSPSPVSPTLPTPLNPFHSVRDVTACLWVGLSVCYGTWKLSTPWITLVTLSMPSVKQTVPPLSAIIALLACENGD
jgi:hypothetical protein